MITVYTQPNCQPCRMTKMKLDKLGLAYTVVDVSEDEEAKASLLSQGFMSLPVVAYKGDTWSGFRPTMIDNIAREITNE